MCVCKDVYTHVKVACLIILRVNRGTVKSLLHTHFYSLAEEPAELGVTCCCCFSCGLHSFLCYGLMEALTNTALPCGSSVCGFYDCSHCALCMSTLQWRQCFGSVTYTYARPFMAVVYGSYI